MLNETQIAALLKPIKPSRILHANGQSHVPAYDVAAHLTRIFGYGGWDTENCVATLSFEESELRKKRNSTEEYMAWTVGYTATIRLVIKDEFGTVVAHYENGAGGDAVNQPSRGDAHHLAMTTAISTALKRCAAFGLGDQFGLSLYNKGATGALVGKLLSADTDVQDHTTKPESLGNDERQDKEERTESTLSTLWADIKDHPEYTKLGDDRGKWLSDTVGYEVKSPRDLSDDDCEQVLAVLKAKL